MNLVRLERLQRLLDSTEHTVQQDLSGWQCAGCGRGARLAEVESWLRSHTQCESSGKLRLRAPVGQIATQGTADEDCVLVAQGSSGGQELCVEPSQFGDVSEDPKKKTAVHGSSATAEPQAKRAGTFFGVQRLPWQGLHAT